MSGQADRRMTWADFMRQAHERPLSLAVLEDIERMLAAGTDPERTASSLPAPPIKR
jgi:hypothetical protein